MERLQRTSIILMIVILTGYSWTIGGWSFGDRSSNDDSKKTASNLAINDRSKTSDRAVGIAAKIPRPLRVRSVNNRQAESSSTPKRFHSGAPSDQLRKLKSDSQGASYGITASILADLPKLNFAEAVETKSRKRESLIKGFPGLKLPADSQLPNSPSNHPVTSATEVQQAPRIQTSTTHFANRVVQPQLSPMIQLSPAVVTAYFQKVRYGNSLARRGAVASAKTELKDALMILVEAADQASQTQNYSAAIYRAWRALKEVDDFKSANQDAALFIAGHETQALTGFDPRTITHGQARAAYFSFAEKQFLAALGNLSIASEAFRSLGKIYSISDKFAPDQTAMATAKSMVMFRLATTVNVTDSNAARELGVLYTSYNRLHEAKLLFVRALRYQRDETTWANLAKVHQALGENHLAQQAFTEARICSASNRRTQMIQWTNPGQFQQVQSMVDPPIMNREYRSAHRTDTMNQPGSRR